MIEVTQADRELLIELISFDSETIDAILAGNAFTWEVEQIARHRIAAENAALERAAKVADELGGVRPKTADQEPFRAQHTRANTIATAIRALKGPTDDPA